MSSAVNIAVVVTGTRGELTANQRAELTAAVTALAHVVIVGDCPTGADALALEFARSHRIPVRVLRVDPSQPSPQRFHNRNQAIADKAAVARDHGWQVVYLAFPSTDSRGTWDCKRRLEQLGFVVSVVR